MPNDGNLKPDFVFKIDKKCHFFKQVLHFLILQVDGTLTNRRARCVDKNLDKNFRPIGELDAEKTAMSSFETRGFADDLRNSNRRMGGFADYSGDSKPIDY